MRSNKNVSEKRASAMALADAQHVIDQSEAADLLASFEEDGDDDIALRMKLDAVHVKIAEHQDAYELIQRLANHAGVLLANFVKSDRGRLKGPDGMGGLIVGTAGTGKSYLVERALEQSRRLNPVIRGVRTSKSVHAKITQPVSRLSIGEDIHRALGVPLAAKHGLKEAEIWDAIREMVREQKVLLLVLDETQHFSDVPGNGRTIRDSVKSLMNDSFWRTNVLLYGLPSLLELLEGDDCDAEQQWRRSSPVLMRRLATREHREALVTAVDEYCLRAGLESSDELDFANENSDFAKRLIKVADGSTGTILDLCKLAVMAAAHRHTLNPSRNVLLLSDFQRAYKVATCCLDSENIFDPKVAASEVSHLASVHAANLRERAEQGRS